MASSPGSSSSVTPGSMDRTGSIGTTEDLARTGSGAWQSLGAPMHTEPQNPGTVRHFHGNPSPIQDQPMLPTAGAQAQFPQAVAVVRGGHPGPSFPQSASHPTFGAQTAHAVSLGSYAWQHQQGSAAPSAPLHGRMPMVPHGVTGDLTSRDAQQPHPTLVHGSQDAISRFAPLALGGGTALGTGTHVLSQGYRHAPGNPPRYDAPPPPTVLYSHGEAHQTQAMPHRASEHHQGWTAFQPMHSKPPGSFALHGANATQSLPPAVGAHAPAWEAQARQSHSQELFMRGPPGQGGSPYPPYHPQTGHVVYHGSHKAMPPVFHAQGTSSLPVSSFSATFRPPGPGPPGPIPPGPGPPNPGPPGPGPMHLDRPAGMQEVHAPPPPYTTQGVVHPPVVLSGPPQAAHASAASTSAPPSKGRRVSSTWQLPDDGYHWHKYGQKLLMERAISRAYFRCAQRNSGCTVRKTVDFPLNDSSKELCITYDGTHSHLPEVPAFSLNQVVVRHKGEVTQEQYRNQQRLQDQGGGGPPVGAGMPVANVPGAFGHSVVKDDAATPSGRMVTSQEEQEDVKPSLPSQIGRLGVQLLGSVQEIETGPDQTWLGRETRMGTHEMVPFMETGGMELEVDQRGQQGSSNPSLSSRQAQTLQGDVGLVAVTGREEIQRFPSQEAWPGGSHPQEERLEAPLPSRSELSMYATHGSALHREGMGDTDYAQESFVAQPQHALPNPEKEKVVEMELLHSVGHAGRAALPGREEPAAEKSLSSGSLMDHPLREGRLAVDRIWRNRSSPGLLPRERVEILDTQARGRTLSDPKDAAHQDASEEEGPLDLSLRL